MIVVLQKPRLITNHDMTEADSLLAFKHPESLFREFNSFLPQLMGSCMGVQRSKTILDPIPSTKQEWIIEIGMATGSAILRTEANRKF
jgi:hypothetical protein